MMSQNIEKYGYPNFVMENQPDNQLGTTASSDQEFESWCSSILVETSIGLEWDYEGLIGLGDQSWDSYEGPSPVTQQFQWNSEDYAFPLDPYWGYYEGPSLDLDGIAQRLEWNSEDYAFLLDPYWDPLEGSSLDLDEITQGLEWNSDDYAFPLDNQ
nr:uncharacterized protein LOC121502113 [Drosophila kikkawai]